MIGLKKHDKVGGQHKIPRLSNSRTYVEELLDMSGRKASEDMMEI